MWVCIYVSVCGDAYMWLIAGCERIWTLRCFRPWMMHKICKIWHFDIPSLNTQTHTCTDSSAHIPLRHVNRTCQTNDALCADIDQKKHRDVEIRKNGSKKRGWRGNKEKVRKRGKPGLREMTVRATELSWGQPDACFAAWEQACLTISFSPLQLYKAWETFYCSNHSDPFGFYSISGCLGIVFHYCFYI